MAIDFKRPQKNRDPFPLCQRQKKDIEYHFDGFKCKILNRSELRCIGLIRPDEDSPVYKVRIIYRPGVTPKVRVLSPKIELSTKTHVYKGGDLCLFYPPDEPWKESYRIVEKTIPWTAEWIVYYELYLITGKWEGPEAPHEPSS